MQISLVWSTHLEYEFLKIWPVCFWIMCIWNDWISIFVSQWSCLYFLLVLVWFWKKFVCLKVEFVVNWQLQTHPVVLPRARIIAVLSQPMAFQQFPMWDQSNLSPTTTFWLSSWSTIKHASCWDYDEYTKCFKKYVVGVSKAEGHVPLILKMKM